MNQLLVCKSTRKLAIGAAGLLLFLMMLPSVAFAAINSTYTVKVDTGYLALRTAPAYDYSNEVGKLYTGDKVTVEEWLSGDYWWVYSSKYDRRGYVNKHYLVSGSASSSSSSDYGNYNVKVDKNYLALRTAPAFERSNEIGELYTGDVVTVKEKPSGEYWYVYSSKYGRSGYVNKNYLVKI